MKKRAERTAAAVFAAVLVLTLSGVPSFAAQSKASDWNAVARGDIANREKREQAKKKTKETQQRDPRTAVVDKEGSGDYTSIQEAIDEAQDGDIIFVLPGIYREHISCRDKTIQISGTSPEEVIIEAENGDYYNPPLEMCTGVLENVTVRALPGKNENALGLSSYALHTDFDEERDGSFIVINCSFENETYPAMGLGLKPGYHVEFTGCSFQSGTSPAIFLHDYECLHPYSAELSQSVSFISCVMSTKSSTQPVIRFQSEELCEGAAKITFVGSRIEGGKKESPLEMIYFNEEDDFRQLSRDGFLDSSDWELQEESRGNSLPELNFR